MNCALESNEMPITTEDERDILVKLTKLEGKVDNIERNAAWQLDVERLFSHQEQVNIKFTNTAESLLLAVEEIKKSVTGVVEQLGANFRAEAERSSLDKNVERWSKYLSFILAFLAVLAYVSGNVHVGK